MPGIIVHEWISERGGSENVAEAMADVFPDADLFALWNDAPDRFPGRTVRESWLARTPLRRAKAAALPFMPSTWAALDVREYDFVLASSHLFAHHAGGATSRVGVPKFVYVHTPARYIWTPELDARGSHPLARVASPALRRIDRARAAEATSLAANSEYVQRRIERAWGRESLVIHPPVDVASLQSVPDWAAVLSPSDASVLAGLPEQFVLGASRFVAYKGLDTVIDFGAAVDLPVVLAGGGPLEARLRAHGETVGIPVFVVRNPSDGLLRAIYQRALVYVFPAVEDFGIMPVEAMALGTPVIVGAAGGARESVEAVDGGAVADSFVGTAAKEALAEALAKDMSATARKAGMFSYAAFAEKLAAWVEPGSRVPASEAAG